MSQSDSSNRSNWWGGFITMEPQQLVQIALLGVSLGTALWLLTLLIRQVILVPLFCGDPTAGLCVAAATNASGIATVLIAVAGVLGLIRLGVYRPLLIAIATLISLWGLGSLVAELQWFEALAWSIFMYAAAYVAFAWLVRPRSIIPALILVALAVVIVRLMLVL